MTEDFDHLSDEDYEAIPAIVEPSAGRRRGEDILAAVDARDNAREEPAALLEALARAYEAREAEQQ